MKLYITTPQGKDIRIITSATTKQQLIETHGHVFSVEDQLQSYHVNQIKATPDPDTSYGWAFLLLMFVYAMSFHLIISISSSVVGFVIGKILYFRDIKKVEKFNNS